MARTTYTELNGEIVPEVLTDGVITTPRNTIQARALADGVDIYSGVLSTAGDQTTFTPPHPLRSCTTYQWYWDDLRGFGGLPIRAPRDGETYGVEVAPERISDAYSTAMIQRGTEMFNFGSRNATQDTFTIDTSNVGNSGEYYCVISVGLEASQCIRVESSRNRVSIVECLEVNGATTPSNPAVRRRHTFPAEGGMVDIRAIHPHYESISFDTENSGFSQQGDALLQNPLPNVVDTTYTVEASPTIQARQAYVNLNIGSFQCSYAFTQTYELSTRTRDAGAVPASTMTAQRETFGPVIGIVSDSGPSEAGSTTVLTAEARYFNNSLTSFTANDIGTIAWTVDSNVGSITASEAVIGNAKVGTAVFTPVDNTFTGTVEVTASVDGTSHSRTITYVTATTATDADGNTIQPATVIRGTAEGDVFCSSLDGTTQLPTLTGEFEVQYSDALIQFDVDHTNFFDASASNTQGASRTLQYNILGPTMLDGSISATASSGRVSSEQFTLTPGTYTWSIMMTNCSTPFAGDGGAGRMRTFPTVYS